MSYATCHTEGCANAQVPIDVGSVLDTDPATGEQYRMTCQCGVCGQLITDITDEGPTDG